MADDPNNPDPKDKPDPDAGAKKALEAERAARREADKTVTELRTRLKDLEDRDKDESQKLLDRIAAAEQKAAEADKKVEEAKAETLRLSVAAEKGLKPAQAKRLAGTTREELEADADDLLASFTPTKEGDDKDETDPKPAGRPKEDLKGGSDPTSSAVETNPAKLAEAVPRI